MTDPIFFTFIFSLGMFAYLKRDRLAELFSSGITSGKPILDSDYLYIMILTMLSYYPLSVILSQLFSTYLIQFEIFGIVFFFIVPTLLAGFIYTLVYSPIWYNTLGGDKPEDVLGLMVSVMFGAFFATYVAVGLGLSTDIIRKTYGYYVEMALDILRFISLMAILPVIQRFIEYAYTIFKNNLFVTLRGALFSAIGGIFGFGVMLGMIPLFATATVAGIFGGLLLRNNIDFVFAPIASLLAVIGVPPFWHTFYEFMAFSLISMSVGMLVYTAIKRSNKVVKYYGGITVGVLVLIFGAFNEVTVSASVAAIFRSILDFSPVISEISMNAGYVAAFALTWITVIVFTLIATYFIELLVKFVEEVGS